MLIFFFQSNRLNSYKLIKVVYASC